MGRVITLKGETASLRLELIVEREPPSELDWWRVYLVSDETLFLGAECLIIIRKKLTDYLMGADIEKKQPYERDGEKLIYITTLAEKHTSLYGSIPSINTGLKIYCQDCDARFIATIHLNKQDIENWIMELDKYDT